jgi:hypothetical protein
MYLAASAVIVSMLLGALPQTTGEETESQPTRQYTVLCRWVDADDNVVVGPKLTLSEGEKGNVSIGSRSPFVVGITADEDGAKKPLIAVIDEGTTIEVTAVGQQANGVTVNVVVEQSEITSVETKKTGPGTFVQAPHVDARKKRVVDFVKFGEILTVPTEEKRADGTTPRVELAVCAGNAVSIPSNWTSPAASRKNAGDDESDGIFDELLATGDARVRCERVSRWEKSCGHGLYEDLCPLRDLCDLADLYCTHCPHRFGLADVLCLLAPMIGDPVRVRHLEESLFGYEWGYSVELADSPSLPSQVALLSRVPELWDLVVQSERYGYPLLHALTKVNVRHDLELCGENQAGVTKDGWLRQQWCLHHDAPGHATLTLDAAARLSVEDAESALPALKATPNLKQVFVVAEDEEGAKRLARTQEILEKALPNMNIDTFILSPHETADRRGAAGPGNELR